MSTKLTLTQALCIVNSGWLTDAEHKLYLEAQSMVYKEARRLKIDREIDATTEEHNEKLRQLIDERAELGDSVDA